ncbi:MAG: hypothetical protein IT381_28440 [Deltaproteobacteria bacterium]|nr:hypothetical protein [Deltaproteobacteria bacterium]
MRRSVAAIVMLGWSACAPPAEQRESCSDAACTTGASECAEDGTLVVCTPDEDGCGSYPSSGHACLEGACIERDDDTAYCPCTDDPGCSAAWSACDDDGAIFGCAANEEGCIKPMRTTCAPPLVCVNPPSAQSSCGCPPATLAGFGVPLPVQRGGGCPMLGALGCDVLTSAMDECVTDAGCQIWREKMRCEEVGLRCSGSAGSGAFCQCPNTNGPSFYVDAAAGSTNNPDQTKFSATGAESPAKCRFKTIAAAMLAASNARAKFKDISVIATGAGVAPMTFGAATTGESGFFISGGVTLTTDEPAGTAPGKYVLAPSSSLTLDMGATLRQFAVVFDANTPSYFRGITSLCNVTGIIPPPQCSRSTTS